MEQDALSKTIMVQGVSIDSLLENSLQDTKYNMAGIKSAITSEIDSFITQTFAENDITETLLAAHVNIWKLYLHLRIWNPQFYKAPVRTIQPMST